MQKTHQLNYIALKNPQILNSIEMLQRYYFENDTEETTTFLSKSARMIWAESVVRLYSLEMPY
jgi:hypothetical protein